jgi:hypothetical protein
MDILYCIEKYFEISKHDKFISHWQKLAEKLIEGIKQGYNNACSEDKIVQDVELIINSIGDFETQIDRKKIIISTKSIFIHGRKSQVKFKYYGKETQRELGDIIFILSVVYKNKKYFEKLTINQVKKAKPSSPIKWNFNNKSSLEQLYLLSRFPSFKGVKGSLILPQKEYKLPNYSNCLGTHGFLYYPGDFALVSSKLLDIILSSRKRTFYLKDLLNLEYLEFVNQKASLLFWRNVYNLFSKFCKFRYFFPNWQLPLLINKCVIYNAYDFAREYLLGHIGELIYAKEEVFPFLFPQNNFALRFLQDLLSMLESRSKKDKAVQNFISSFNMYSYANLGGGGSESIAGSYDMEFEEGGGIGIVHTVINLGEAE